MEFSKILRVMAKQHHDLLLECFFWRQFSILTIFDKIIEQVLDVCKSAGLRLTTQHAKIISFVRKLLKNCQAKSVISGMASFSNKTFINEGVGGGPCFSNNLTR